MGVNVISIERPTPLHMPSYGIWVWIILYGTSPGVYQWDKDSRNGMYVQRGLEDGYRDGSGEITVTKINTKEIAVNFTGCLKSLGNKTIYVEGNFLIPRD